MDRIEFELILSFTINSDEGTSLQFVLPRCIPLAGFNFLPCQFNNKYYYYCGTYLIVLLHNSMKPPFLIFWCTLPDNTLYRLFWWLCHYLMVIVWLLLLYHAPCIIINSFVCLSFFADNRCLLSLFRATHSFHTASLGKGPESDGMHISSVNICPSCSI